MRGGGGGVWPRALAHTNDIFVPSAVAVVVAVVVASATNQAAAAVFLDIHIENFSFPSSRNFLRRWRKENRDSPLPALAVQSYDAVAVLEAAFASILQQRPGMLKAGASSSGGGGGGAGRFGRKGQLYCDMSPDSVQVIIKQFLLSFDNQNYFKTYKFNFKIYSRNPGSTVLRSPAPSAPCTSLTP